MWAKLLFYRFLDDALALEESVMMKRSDFRNRVAVYQVTVLGRPWLSAMDPKIQDLNNLDKDNCVFNQYFSI
ncbi:MAG TPA: hypothetical protein ENH62_11595 [Marinobacter sp.]|uniref:Uncharacterized protein n=1 Tax=Marinobacter antarcticus TaxID=564117 RepID=A0A831R298_9GAMM|nr:hypothetical protein [Marinobacter antarcticus]HDZ38911.1 hypothetical protein [Marinobacter sp.]HEA50815.1 hypothetical protein [Marinobacter antarcticus]